MQDKVKKVLIAEDNPDFLYMLKGAFDDAGLSALLAKDGQECVQMAKEENPDIVIMDVMMPKMDGIEAARKLKEMGIKAPVIFLTNAGDFDKISSAMEVSPTDYIVKADVSLEDVVSRVKDKLNIK